MVGLQAVTIREKIQEFEVDKAATTMEEEAGKLEEEPMLDQERKGFHWTFSGLFVMFNSTPEGFCSGLKNA